MRAGLIVVVGLGIAAAAWWALGRRGPEEPPPEPPAAERATGEAPEAGAPLALEGAAPSAEPAPTAPSLPKAVRPQDLPRGGLVVTAVAPDGEAYAPSETRVFVEALGRAAGPMPMGIPDADARAWRFERIPAGRVRLRVRGDHVVETSIEAEVEAGQVKDVRLHADRAGAFG